MDDRDHFAAAALTGLIRGIPSDSIFHLGLMANTLRKLLERLA